MSTAEKQRYNEILDAALFLDEAERTRFLARHAESEVPAIRDAILVILASDTPTDEPKSGPETDLDLYGESNLPDFGSRLPVPRFFDFFFAGSPDGSVLGELLAERQYPFDNPFAGTDRFEVIRLLGKGGFGEVYEVWDRSHRSHLALKVLRNLHPAALESFKRESRLPERIVHPNLCQTWELIFDAPSRLWLLTMELVRGRHLSAFLRDHRHRLRDVFFQVSDGLNTLHAAGVLHCDIKPSNVLVTDEGHVKLLDFGLARLHNSALMGAPVGATPEYAAPELRAGNPNSVSSDWYAVGVMLYRALTGESPFPFGNRTNPLVAEPAVEPELADLARLAVQLLQSDPASRLPEPGFSGILSPSRSTSGPTASFLAGREGEIRTLRNAFAECLQQDRCVVVEVIGDAGVGKTALIEAFLSHLSTTTPDAVVLSGKCYEGESVPYKALDELIDTLAARLLARSLREARRILPPDFTLLARLFPVLETVLPPGHASGAQPAAPSDQPDPLPLRHRAFAAFRQLIQNLRAVAPLILFIDDLQWGDPDSALLLRELTHSEAPAILLLLARRSQAVGTEEASHLRSARTIDLRPLTPAQSMSLVRDLLGHHHPSVALEETAAQIAAESGGSPFLIRQLVEHYRRGGVSGGNRLQHIINVRAATLGEPERRLLEVLSVARAPVTLDVLSQAAELGEQAFAARISLVRLSLALDSDSARNTCSAFHDRIAEAVVEALPDARRRDIHLRLATSLETAPDPEAETIARHYHAAERPTDACRLGRLAAERASTAFAFDRAARLYSEVLEWAAQARLWNEAERSPLCCELGNALVNAGRGIEGARAYANALEGAPPASRIHLRIRFAEELLRSGEVDEGLAAIRRILREHRLPVPVSPRAAMVRLVMEHIRARLSITFPSRAAAPQLNPAKALRLDVCWAAAVGTAMVYPLLTEMYCVIYFRLAIATSDPVRLAIAWSSYASRLAYTDDGTVVQARQFMARAATYEEQSADPYACAFVGAMWAVVEMLSGNWACSQEHARQARDRFRNHCHGVSWELASTTSYLFTSRAIQGDWITNRHEIPLALNEARERGDRYAQVVLNLVCGTYSIYLVDDKPDAAEAMIVESLSAWPRGEFDIQQLYAFQGLVDLDLYRDRADRAWQRVRNTWPAVERSRLFKLTLLEVFAVSTRGRAAIAVAALPSTDHRERLDLLKIVDRCARRLLTSTARYAPGLGHILAAGAALIRGDKTSVRAHLESAISNTGSNRLVPWLATCQIVLGRLIDENQNGHLQAAGMAWITSQEIQNHECLIRMLFPAVSLCSRA